MFFRVWWFDYENDYEHDFFCYLLFVYCMKLGFLIIKISNIPTILYEIRVYCMKLGFMYYFRHLLVFLCIIFDIYLLFSRFMYYYDFSSLCIIFDIHVLLWNKHHKHVIILHELVYLHVFSFCLVILFEIRFLGFV